ncbi:MAG: penicillin-binding transpeptidase domain-containing protein, partial [Mesonia sp.]
YMGLNEKIGLDIQGEGQPHIPHPDDANWYGTTLPWMSFGYGVTITPLQTLAFYNAIANNGVMIKPRLIKEIRNRDKIVEHYEEGKINNSICSKETASKVREMMKNTVLKGTGANIYTEEFSMAGKTGTCLTGYGKGDGASEYVASFAGYFPADEPKYSCIVVVTKPNRNIGYYGSTVAAPIFKEIAQEIYTDTPTTNEYEGIEVDYKNVKEDYEQFYTTAQKYKSIMPNVEGLPAMDAVSLLENLGLKVVLKGAGKVRSQSVISGKKITSNQTIYLTTT